ncbi:tRNA 2-selenouridine(34) synthase MnmH [Histidinibacterium lentulum]|uniref:tRNA 2-selenouridine(34) synthase MnmH n=1 Tax=Histidinibacterium lentulum TaxID=2480588 RepID=A0A3N2R1F7_9RHOB|nr:tRNA 2-selenouridine(34) synthase MnmH [Histidinibacterium lentulum]ROU01213.1 tRNA 2-selenouridine(34) synthase MnmH [Histidinibacterium lentulum]
MALTFPDLAAILNHGHDTLIDVRSPAEYAEDHIPGAINLPVLSNEERAIVGTIYVQDSPFRARKIGAAMIFRNAAAHIEGPLARHEGGWRPLVYCWRGGQRSGSFAYLLQEIGWRAEAVKGGWQAYRRLVHTALYDTPLPHRVVLLDGYTGTAKTDLLPRLAARGLQVIDLEGLANHRGSLLGARAGGQPSQKGWESALAGALAAIDPARPLVLEAESNKVGDLLIPPALWAAMKAAPRVEIAAPLPARAAYLTAAYRDLWTDAARLTAKLNRLDRLRGRDTVERWLALLEEGRMTELAAALMADHYDPAYTKSRQKIGARTVATVTTGALDEAGLDTAADKLAEAIARL